MRKLLLLFMSMFFVLGTSWAQDDKTDDSAAFELMSVSPADSGQVTTVYNIFLEFSKDVTVTLPEGGIEVVNNDTKEVVKIVSIRVDEWTPKNQVYFQFEQKMVPGKDGKDELQDQYIETPGTYSYTIPAGCIKSVDGEEFAERTFTFTIVGTFAVESYSPQSTDQLDKIQLTFAEEVTDVKFPNSGLYLVDYYWSPVVGIKNDVTISEDKKTVTLELEEPLTVPGQYFLDLYQGVFVSQSGISAYSSLMFNIIDSRPSFSTNLEDGSRVQELGNIVITFNNVKDVKLAEGAEAPKVAAYLPGGGVVEGVATLADNVVTVTFEQQFLEEGEYVFVIPAGMFTMDGVPNEERQLTVTLYTFVVTPLEVVSVTPEVGSVDSIAKISIMYNQPVRLAMDENWQEISREIILTCGEQTYVLTNSPDYSSNASNVVEYLVNAEWNGYEYISTPITAAGTYTLNLADIVVNYAGEEYIDEWGWPNTKWNAVGSCEGVYTWTVTGGTSIEDIKIVEGKQVIYDLLGRRVEKIIGTGIYIVNGKKVVIK